MAVLNPIDYGAKGNAKFYNPLDGNWYQDASFTTLADDDTDAFRRMLAEAGILNRVFIPVTEGYYNILGTLRVKAGTIIEGEDEHLSKFVLGYGHNLDPVYFRDGNIAPIITTEDNSRDILMKGFSVEGNKRRFAGHGSFAWGMGGIVVQKAKNVKLEHVHVDWININEALDDRRYGFNIVSVDAENIEYYKCSAEYAGYQPFGFFDRTFDSIMHECESGTGWRTSTQVHRDTDNIKILKNRIIQKDNRFEREPHAAVTVHGEPGEEARNVLLEDNYIELKDGYKAAVQVFRKSERFKAINNTVISNGEGFRVGDAVGAVVEYNDITTFDNDIPLEYGNIGINIVDGTKYSQFRFNKINGFETRIHQDSGLSNIIVDREEPLEMHYARLFKKEGGKIVEVDPYVNVGGKIRRGHIVVGH